MAASDVSGAYHNWDDSSGNGLSTGSRDLVAGDLFLSGYKWDGSANPTLTRTDGASLSYVDLASRAHTGSGQTLKGQLAYAPGCPDATGAWTFCSPSVNVPKRQAFGIQIRGLDSTTPQAFTDNIAYRDGSSSALSAAAQDCGSTGGIIIGVLWFTEGADSITVTPGSGWTAFTDPNGRNQYFSLIYKIKSGAGSETPNWTFSGSVHAMCTSLAFKCPAGGGGGGGGGASIVRAYLLPAALTASNLTAFVWRNDPDLVLAKKTTGITPVSANDPDGNAAAKIEVPAESGSSDGDNVVVVVEDPASSLVSSWRVPGKVIGSSGTVNTVAKVLACMNRSTNDVLPDGTVPYAQWARGPALNVMGNRPQGSVLTPAGAAPIPAQWQGSAWWTQVAMWFQIMRGVGSSGSNTRVQLRNIKIWVLRGSGQWQLLRLFTATGAGVYTMASYSPTAIFIYSRDESANGGGESYLLRTDSNFIHGWGGADQFFTQIPNPWDIVNFSVTMQARKILDNPAGTDDRATTVATVACGGDYHPPDLTGYPTEGKPGVGISRAMVVGIDWTPITMSTLDIGTTDQENPAANPGQPAAAFSANPFPFD